MSGDGASEVICGPMFSGKTDELIRRFEAAREDRRSVLALKPARDNRHAADLIVSHSSKQIPARSVASAEAIPAAATGSSLVLIDEVQFFEGTLQTAIAQLRAGGSEAVAVGLDFDFRGDPFATTRDLAAGAARVTRLTAVCGLCQSEATLTQRLSRGLPVPLDAPRLVVGDREIYEPRCERCWHAEREGVVRYAS